MGCTPRVRLDMPLVAPSQCVLQALAQECNTPPLQLGMDLGCIAHSEEQHMALVE